MELNYKIKVTQMHNTSLDKVLKKTSDKLEMNVFKFKDSITLKSNSDRISNHYKKSINKVASIKNRGDTILGFDWDSESLSLFKPEVSEEFLEGFLQTKYHKNLFPVYGNKYNCKILDTDSVYLLSLNSEISAATSTDSLRASYLNKPSEIYESTLDGWVFLVREEVNSYTEAVASGFEGTLEEWVELNTGSSLYTIAISRGFIGTEEEWEIVTSSRVLKFSKVPSTNYTLDLANKTINSSSLLLGSDLKLFLLVFNNHFEYIKASDNLSLAKDFFVKYPSGFYQVNPTFENKSEYIVNKTSNSSLKLQANKIFNLTSDLYLNFDNCLTNKFKLLPTYLLNISYSLNDYSPLNLIKTFSPNYEYIVFKLEGDKFIPRFHLAPTNTSDVSGLEEYNLIMQSHEEFKKSFYVICSQINLNITKNEVNLETITITNKDFDNLLNMPSTTSSIKRIKLQ